MSKALVCLPTLNEEQSVALMIGRITDLGLDVVVCDGGSTDATVAIARELGATVIFRERPGKGAGVQKALQYAHEKGYELLVLIDCDETYPVHDIPMLIAHTDKYDMVIGARSQKQVAFINGLANRGFNFLVNALFGGRLMDVNSGMRAMRVKTYRPLIDADNFDVEIQISCRTLKNRIPHLEKPINYTERNGKSKVRYIDGFHILCRIATERLR